MIPSVKTDEIYDIKLDVRQLQPRIGQRIMLALVSHTGGELNIYAGEEREDHIRLSITSLLTETHAE